MAKVKFKNCFMCKLITRAIVFMIAAVAALYLYGLYESGEVTKLPKDRVEESDTTLLVDSEKQDTLYEFSIEFLKKYEGFRSKVYIDNDGSRTIGYGVHMKSWERYTTISKDKADKILRREFDRRIKKAQDMHDGKLKKNEAIAIALFMYNCGSGTYNRSSMKRNIDNGKDPGDVWLKYSHFKKDGVMVVNGRLKERRIVELNIYRNGRER